MMFNEIEGQENVTKVQMTVTLILVLVFSITGATYAYFFFTASVGNTITGNMATVNLTLSVERLFPSSTSENTGVLVPQLSTSGSENSPLANALKSGCVDSNTNVVCQVYKIIIQNVGGSATQVVDGSISFYSDMAMTTDITTTMPNLKWKLIKSVDTTTPANSVLGTNVDLTANANVNVFADDITMVTDSSFTYYVIIWINETNADQTIDEGNSFYGKVEFNSSNGTGVTAAFSDF